MAFLPRPYRDYEALRRATNDAMMALLVASRLANDAVAPHARSNQRALLPGLFPEVEGVDRLNVAVGHAARHFESSERYLTYVAIPFALGVHGQFIASAITIARDAGLDSSADDVTRIELSVIHERLEEAIGSQLPVTELRLFHLARQIRNRIVHHAGRQGHNLRREYEGLNHAEKTEWEEITRRAPRWGSARDLLDIDAAELFATFAITRRLSEAVNKELATRVSREWWAFTIGAEYADLKPERFAVPHRRLRRVCGHARHYYGDLGLTQDEIRAGLERMERGL